MDKGSRHKGLATNQATDRLKDPKSFSRWNPAWGLLGIGLPLTFAGQVRPAAAFLRASELIPLYATELIILGLLGLAATGLFAVLDRLLVKWRCGADPRTAAKVGFAVIIAISFFFGVWTWIATFRNAALLPNSFKGYLFAFAAAACIAAVRGWFQTELAVIATMARFLALVGSATLLSLPFVSGATPLPYNHHPTANTRSASRPNIVLISIDALAAEHLQPYGSQRATSPNIAEFSSHAIVFEQFHANANFTTPGIASIMTGVRPYAGHD